MGNYFEGWYFKCQEEDKPLALIPARHRFRGKTTCSLQVITDEKAFFLPLPGDSLFFDRENFTIRLGENSLGRQGIRLNLEGGLGAAVHPGSSSRAPSPGTGDWCHAPSHPGKPRLRCLLFLPGEGPNLILLRHRPGFLCVCVSLRKRAAASSCGLWFLILCQGGAQGLASL